MTFFPRLNSPWKAFCIAFVILAAISAQGVRDGSLLIMDCFIGYIAYRIATAF